MIVSTATSSGADPGKGPIPEVHFLALKKQNGLAEHDKNKIYSKTLKTNLNVAALLPRPHDCSSTKGISHQHRYEKLRLSVLEGQPNKTDVSKNNNNHQLLKWSE